MNIDTDETLSNLYNERDAYRNGAISNMNSFGAALNSFYGLVGMASTQQLVHPGMDMRAWARYL